MKRHEEMWCVFKSGKYPKPETISFWRNVSIRKVAETSRTWSQLHRRYGWQCLPVTIEVRRNGIKGKQLYKGRYGEWRMKKEGRRTESTR